MVRRGPAQASCRMFRLDLLGPVVLTRAGVALPLPVRKTAALLVVLALGGAMPRARIVAMLWPSLDEPTGRRNLRRELARLRELGADGVVLADDDRLRLAPAVAVDLRPWSAAGDAQSAMPVWRAALADGLDLPDAGPFTEWLDGQRERLKAQWRERTDALVSAAEARGDTGAALTHLDRLIDDDPLQERHHCRAMTLLAATGRRDAALERYQRCRALLQAELGLEPTAETEALAAALRGSAAAAAQVLAPRRPNPASACLPAQLPFVGREVEVAWLERAWRAGGPILIEGEGGVGKSRLALDFAAAHGPVAVVRCHPADAELPLASVARALRVLSGAQPSTADLPAWVAAELARLLPEFGPPPLPLRTAPERERFGDAVAIAWLHWAGGNFDAVVLDDWHLADAASQALLPRLLARRDATAVPLRELLVFRPELAPAAAERLQRLRDGGAAWLSLAPLAPDAVLELLQRLSGAARPERFARRLAAATGGHPFHLAETLQHLMELGLLLTDAQGVWHTPYDEDTEDYRELPLPASVREAVLGRVRRLPEPAQRMLDAAALAGEPFRAALLAPACALSEIDAALALEQAHAARLLREREGGGWGFEHDLVPQALSSAMDPARRRSVHRRLALGAASAGAEPAQVAAHHEAGGEPQRAVAWRRRAAQAAFQLHALDEAVVQWRRARDDGGDLLDARDALAIGQALLRALQLRGQLDAARAEAMALLARVEAGEGPPEARVDALLAAAGHLAYRDENSLAQQWLDRLPAALPARQQAAALRVRASVLRGRGRVEDSVAATRAALALPELPADDRAYLLDSLTMSALAAGRYHEALRHTEAVLALSREIGDSWGSARAECRRATLLVQVAEPAAAEAALCTAARRAGELGMIADQRATLFNLCVLHANRNQAQQVLAVARACWDLAPPLPQEALRTQLRLAFVEAHGALGELGAAWTWMQGAIDDALAIGQFAGLAGTLTTGFELLTLLGETSRAEPLLAALADAGEMRQLLGEMHLVRAECALLSGDLPTAQRERAAAGGPAEPQRQRVREAVLDAALRAAQGDAAGALALLPADDAPGHNDELRWRALAVRVAAEHRLGAVAADSVARVESALGRQGVHAVAQWLLHRACARAVPSQADAFGRRCAELSASLADHPVQRAAFDRHGR